MGRFQNEVTKVVVHVADEKDDRYRDGSGWLPYTADDAAEPAEKKARGRRPKAEPGNAADPAAESAIPDNE